jgi:hypothetical protein
MDGPGLMDSNGAAADEANIRTIVDYVKARGSLAAMPLVLNGAHPRFDKPMQDIVKLLVDSFGAGVVGVMCVVFTRASQQSASQAAQMVADMQATIAQRCGLPAGSVRLPHFRVECKADELELMGVPAPDAIKAAARALTETAVGDLLRWASLTTPVDTAQAVYGEYEAAKAKREADERAEAEAARAAAEAARAAAAAADAARAEAARAAAQQQAAAEAARAEAAAAEAARERERAQHEAERAAAAQQQAAAAQQLAAAERARADAEKARADAAAAAARSKETFISLSRGFKIGGKRIW